MHNTIYSFLFLAVIFISCRTSSDENNKKADLIVANSHSNKAGAGSIDVHLNLKEENCDTLLKNKGGKNEVISVKGWTIDDFIINDKDKKSKAVRSTIEYKREEWENVKNPIVATFKGCDFGDYFHLNFEDANGKNYDFGFGNNNYGEYLLFDKTDYNDNPEYLGKTFKICWNWKITSFPCCDGDYEKVEAYLPSITKLELIETTASEK